MATQVACSVVSQKPFTCPQKGGAADRGIKARTSCCEPSRPRRRRAHSAQLEWTLAALASLGFGADQPPKTRIEVVYFRREQDAHSFSTDWRRGAFYWNGRHDLERTPLACVYGDFVNATRRTFQHELTHFLGAHVLRPCVDLARRRSRQVPRDTRSRRRQDGGGARADELPVLARSLEVRVQPVHSDGTRTFRWAKPSRWRIS